MTSTPCEQEIINDFSSMQHPKPHITLYWAVISLSWDDEMLHSVESLMTIIFSMSLASLIIPSSGVLTMLL